MYIDVLYIDTHSHTYTHTQQKIITCEGYGTQLLLTILYLMYLRKAKQNEQNKHNSYPEIKIC